MPDRNGRLSYRRSSYFHREKRYAFNLSNPVLIKGNSAMLFEFLAAMLLGGLVAGAAGYVCLRQHRQLSECRSRLHAIAEARARTGGESGTILQRAILAHASYAIIATDQDGIIQLFNPAAERMLGYAAAEMLGKHSVEIVHDRGEVLARAAALSQELGMTIVPGFAVFTVKPMLGISEENEFTYIRKNGSRFPVQLSVSALREEDGTIIGYLGIAADISLREQGRRKLTAARDQLFDAAEVAELGIWTWALADDAIAWNERMYEFYDVPLDQRGIGLNYADWRARIHPDDVDGAFAKLMGLIAGTNKYDTVFRVFRSDGQVRYIQAAASVERDALGKAVRVLGINRDITSQHHAEEALRAATLAADGANRAKSEFLANMSHEIRSPMNAVLGMLMLLKQTALDPRQYDYVSKAEGAGRALLGILNDILDFSRVEAGKLTLDPQPFSIDQLLREVGVILSINVGEKKIDLLYELDPALPDWVVGDAMRLQQVLLNLTGNAIKFTEQGEVLVKVSLLPPEQGEQPGCGQQALRLGFVIRDTGIGISPEQCERVFEGFAQAEASTARRYGGSGLGLAISQRLVALMDGSVTVESKVGHGSAFSFDIACQAAPAPQPVARSDASRLRELKCLVVGDHAGARASMTGMLGRLGWDVDAVASCFDALEAIRRCGAIAYDVVFVDWHMQGMDGWETSERIRHLLAPQHATLIIMVAAHGRKVHALHQETARTVLDGFVVKPVTGSMLFDAVADAFGAAQLGSPDAHRPSTQVPRLAGLRLLLVEDNPVNQQVARELLGLDGAIVAVAGDGRAAIEAVRNARPQFDCVLMDIQMPQMDGYAATRAIRAEPGMASLPIIAMTANVMACDRMAAFDAGMNDHVGKPFDLTQMIATILHYTGRAMAESCNGSDAACSAADELLRPGFNGIDALTRFGGNVQLYRRALGSFVPNAAMLLAELPELFSEASRNAVKTAMHSLKGMARTVGAEGLADAAHNIERAVHAGPSRAIWELRYAQLQMASQQAATIGTELAEQLAASIPPAAASLAVDAAMLAAALSRLRKMLDASSLDALPLFDDLLRDYGASMGSELTELTSAIEQFNFAVAAQQCDALLRQLHIAPCKRVPE
jgi:signal transduction histidine kinase/CheY-like chemotaxis protein